MKRVGASARIYKILIYPSVLPSRKYTNSRASSYLKLRVSLAAGLFQNVDLRATVPARANLSDVGGDQGVRTMDLVIWLPGLFALGVLSIAACWAFAEGCVRI
jgi:hypothetical protein